MPFVSSYDGTKIFYYVGGKGEPLVFVHGLGESCRTWEKQIGFFESSGFRVIAPDLRGHGSSEIPKKKIEMRDFAADVSAVLREESVGKADFVGYSMGGLVLLELYSLEPHYFRSLTLESSVPQYPPAQTAALENMGMDEIARQVADFALSPFASDEDKEAVYSIVSKTDKRVYIESAEAACEKSYWDVLPKIEVPVLIITGELDYISPPEAAEEMAKRIPKASVSVLKRIGHMPHREAPELFNEKLLKFLKGETVE